MRYELPLSAGHPPLTLNQRVHWTFRHRVTAQIKEEIGWQVKARMVPALKHPVVTLVWCPPDRRRRDADNLVPTSKACVDGLVAAGVITDDTPAHVDHRMPVIGEPVAAGRLFLLVESAGGAA